MRWMLPVVVVVLGLVTAPAAASTPQQQLAHFFGVPESDVQDVRGLVLPTGGDYTHVLVGRFEREGGVTAGAALLHCDAKQCTGSRVWLHTGEPVQVLGLVDLGGAPTAFPTRRAPGRDGAYEPLPGKRGKWPAIVVQLTERHQTTSSSKWSRGPVTGVELRRSIAVLSLARADHRHPLVFRHDAEHRAPTGDGMTATFRLARPKAGADLEIVVKEQQHNRSRCLRPAPTETRYRPEGEPRHFVRTGLPARGRRC